MTLDCLRLGYGLLLGGQRKKGVLLGDGGLDSDVF